MTSMDVNMPTDRTNDYWSDEAIAGLVGQTPLLTNGATPIARTRITAASRGAHGIEVTLEVDDRVLGTAFEGITNVGVGFTRQPLKAWTVFPVPGPPAVNPVDDA